MYQRLTARQRLSRGEDFAAVRRTGRRMDCGPFRLFVLIFPPASGSAPLRRLGVVASRRVGGAVKRNRAKRLFREVFRNNQELLPPRADVIMVARREFDQYPYHEILVRYIQACRRLAPLSLH